MKKNPILIFFIIASAFIFLLNPIRVSLAAIDAPTLLSPIDNQQVELPATLKWSTIPEATDGYEYRIYDDFSKMDQSSAVPTEKDQPYIKGTTLGPSGTSFTIPSDKLVVGKVYFWRVRACNTFFTECSDFSLPAGSFVPVLAKPKIVSPCGGQETFFPLKLSWRDVEGAELFSYNILKKDSPEIIYSRTLANLRLNPELTFKDPDIIETQVPAGSGLVGGEAYDWYLTAQAGERTADSDTCSFNIELPPPTLSSPRGTTFLPVVLKWDSPAEITEIKSFVWQVWERGKTTLTDTDITSELSSRQVNGLEVGKTYNWRVKSCFEPEGKGCGEYSSSWNFTLGVESPLITNPAEDGKIIALPFTFRWERVEGVDISYVYEIRNTDILFRTPGTMAVINKGDLAPGRSYTFRVQACSKGVCSDWSSRTFKTASLSVSLRASSSSGNAPLEVELTATVSGQATKDVGGKEATINYTFYCDQDNDSTIITPGWADKRDGVTEKSYTTPLICGDVYTETKTYTAKVIVQRDGLDVERRVTITVIKEEVVSPGPPEVPELRSPSDGARVSPTVTLRWRGRLPDNGYYQVSLSGGIGSLSLRDTSLSFPTPPEMGGYSLSYDTTYTWQVRACGPGDPGANCSDYSQPWTFTTLKKEEERPPGVGFWGVSLCKTCESNAECGLGYYCDIATDKTEGSCKREICRTQTCIENPICAESFTDLLEVIIRFIFLIAVIGAPIMILAAAFYYVISAGDPAKLQTAKNIILYTVIGLGIVILARALIVFIKQVITGG